MKKILVLLFVLSACESPLDKTETTNVTNINNNCYVHSEFLSYPEFEEAQIDDEATITAMDEGVLIEVIMCTDQNNMETINE